MKTTKATVVQVIVKEVVGDANYVLVPRDEWEKLEGELARLRTLVKPRLLRERTPKVKAKEKPRRTLTARPLPMESRYQGVRRSLKTAERFWHAIEKYDQPVKDIADKCIRKLVNNESLNSLDVRPMVSTDRPEVYSKSGKAYWAKASDKWRIGFVIESDTLTIVDFMAKGDRRHNVEA